MWQGFANAVLMAAAAAAAPGWGQQWFLTGDLRM